MSSSIGRFLILSFPYRRFIMRRFAPKYFDEIYGNFIRHREFINNVPRGFVKYMKLMGVPCSVGVEIGVAQGRNSESIFQELNPKTMYLIDPYDSYFELGMFFEVTSEDEEEMLERLESYLDRVILFRQTSEMASPKIPKNLDFVYIDGCHEGNFVLKDLIDFYPKVKKGGVISGHDIQIPSVLEAVKIFCDHMGLSFLTWDFDFIIQK